MPQSSAGHVFMSYSRRDDVVMRRIVIFLRQQGIKVWVDNEKLTPGTPIWEVEIEKAIQGASAVIAVLSPDSKNSEWVRREISLADQYRKRVFPVLVHGDEETSITLRLINRQFVDIRKDEEAGLNSVSASLVHYLEELDAQEQKAKEDANHLAAQKARNEKRQAKQKAEEERLVHEKVEAEQKAKEEAQRLATQKADDEWLAREESEAQQKSETERKAKAEAERLVAEKAEDERSAREEAEAEQKTEEQRIATEKAEVERKEKEEAQNLVAQRTEGERLAREKIEAEQRAEAEHKIEEAQLLALQKAENERIAKEKIEADRLAAVKVEADRRTKQKAEEDRIAKAKIEADRLVAEKAEAERNAKQQAEEIHTDKSIGFNFWAQWIGIFLVGIFFFALPGFIGLYDGDYSSIWFLILGVVGGVIGGIQSLFLRKYGLKSGAGWITTNIIAAGISGGVLAAMYGDNLGLDLLISWAILNFFGGPVLLLVVRKKK